MALKIAKYIINHCNTNGIEINNWRLQRYLYLVQLFGNFLFDEDFEAWDMGPVVPDVYYEYCHNGFHNIKLNKPFIHDFNSLTQTSLEIVLSFCDKLTTEQLTEFTNGSDSPWKRLYNGTGHHGRIIPKSEIARHAIELKNLRKEYDKRNAEQNKTDKTVKTGETETVHQTVSEKTTVSYGSQSIHKHVTVELDVDIKLEKNDIFNWLNACDDAETLRYLGKFALKRAKNIENPDNDDFRSII